MNTRQARFIDEYLSDGNGAVAARRAGYSEKSAKVTASRLLTNVNVRAALARKQAERQAVLNVSRDVVVRELLSSAEVAKMRGDSMTVIRHGAVSLQFSVLRSADWLIMHFLS